MTAMRSARLFVRDIRLEDAPYLLALNADNEVLRYVHDEPFSNEQAARDWIRSIGTELPSGIGRWSVTLHDGTWIGRCSLRRRPNGEVLMGYRLLRSHWGQGYATEAVGTLLDFAFGTHRVPYVLSIIAQENTGSRRVAEKNGGRLWVSNAGDQPLGTVVYRFDRPGGQ